MSLIRNKNLIDVCANNLGKSSITASLSQSFVLVDKSQRLEYSCYSHKWGISTFVWGSGVSPWRWPRCRRCGLVPWRISFRMIPCHSHTREIRRFHAIESSDRDWRGDYQDTGDESFLVEQRPNQNRRRRRREWWRHLTSIRLIDIYQVISFSYIFTHSNI